MKKAGLFGMLFACTVAAKAQIFEFSSKEDSLSAAKIIYDSTATIQDKLVRLSLAGPLFKGSEHQNKINEYQLRKAKSSWLNLLTISTNYNDQTLLKSAATMPVVYPKYFFGVSIPLGIIFSQGTETKAARQGVALSRNNQAQLARNIKADILTKYLQYSNYSDLIALQSEVINDEQVAQQQAEQRFKDGRISIEVYNTAQKVYNGEAVKALGLKMQQELLKIEIERIIGVPLEMVLDAKNK